MKWVFIIVGGVLVFIVGQTFIFDLIIPDPCFYHTNETNFLIELFFDLNPGNNSHPEPNILYIIFSLVIGSILGHSVYRTINNIKLKTTYNNI